MTTKEIAPRGVQALFGYMTVEQVSRILGISERTVQEHAKALYPDSVKNGVRTLLDEEQVTKIKQAYEKSGRNDLANVREVSNATTSLEIAEMTLKVIAYHKGEADRLRAELTEAAPKIESFDALMRSSHTMSITQCAKHFGLHPRTQVIPYLRDRGYLTSKDMPSQPALDAGYLALREVRCPNGDVRPQAVVLACQLETWRTRVIPSIEQWEATV